MATRPKKLSPLERGVLETAVHTRGGGIWLKEETLDTLETTYKAILRLEKMQFLERKPKDALRWKITKEGREELRRT